MHVASRRVNSTRNATPSLPFAVGDGGALTPSLEVGLRIARRCSRRRWCRCAARRCSKRAGVRRSRTTCTDGRCSTTWCGTLLVALVRAPPHAARQPVAGFGLPPLQRHGASRREGPGVALGHTRMIAGELDQGTLVPLFDGAAPSPRRPAMSSASHPTPWTSAAYRSSAPGCALRPPGNPPGRGNRTRPVHR